MHDVAFIVYTGFELLDTAGPASVWTSAGVTTGIDMALAMIADDLDARVAGEVAQRLILYARRPGYQSQFSPVLQAQVRGDSPFADLIGGSRPISTRRWTCPRWRIVPA
jgi:hypothetical protein